MKEWWGKLEKRFKWGVGFSTIWLIVAFAYVWGHFGWTKFWNLPPNEMGDFFAGASAPLAFLWLVLGYMQQGEEIKETRVEIKRQADSIEANELHARRDTFFRLADIMNSTQSALLSDCMKLYAPEHLIKEYWNEFSKGDSDIFYRNFQKIVLQNYIAKPERLETDSEESTFNLERTAQLYIENYERLTKDASGCDPDRSILSMIEWGEKGAVYIGFCKILKRKPTLYLMGGESHMTPAGRI